MCDLTLPGTTKNMIEFHQRRVLLLNEDDRGHSQATSWLGTFLPIYHGHQATSGAAISPAPETDEGLFSGHRMEGLQDLNSVLSEVS